MSTRADEAKRIMAAIRDVLVQDWDPIGVMDEPDWPRDEYDRYIGAIYRLLVRGESAESLAKYLGSIEANAMGLGATPESSNLAVAHRLKRIDVAVHSND